MRPLKGGTADIEHAKRGYRRAPIEIMWHLACVEMCDESIVRMILRGSSGANCMFGHLLRVRSFWDQIGTILANGEAIFGTKMTPKST